MEKRVSCSNYSPSRNRLSRYAKSQRWACKAQKTHLFKTEIDTTHPELILKDKPYIDRSIATWELHEQDSWVSVLIESLAKPANQIAWCLISGIFTGKIFAEPFKTDTSLPWQRFTVAEHLMMSKSMVTVCWIRLLALPENEKRQKYNSTEVNE